MQEVYRGGNIEVKEKKDELVLQLDKQLRERISQQQEMLLQLRNMEEQAAASDEFEIRGAP